jgi:NitT/TauT family transport system permease protein
VDPFFFSSPSSVLVRAWELGSTGRIWIHLGATVAEAGLAFVIGSALGGLCGFALARSPFWARVWEPFIQVANALPRVVLAPVFLLWFGLGIASKVALGVTVIFFLVFFNTFQGVRDVPQRLLDNARLLGATPAQLARHVLLPSALVWIFSSLHVSAGMAIIAAVVGEYMGATRGVGYLIAQAESVFDTTGVFAGMAWLAIVVLLIARLVRVAERRLLAWKAGPEPGQGAAL